MRKNGLILNANWTHLWNRTVELTVEMWTFQDKYFGCNVCLTFSKWLLLMIEIYEPVSIKNGKDNALISDILLVQ